MMRPAIEPTDKITIFYSWQSDLDRATNSDAVRTAIQLGSIDVEAQRPECRLQLDEATRDLPGSPDIASSIFSKISSADIFICDVTTINNSPDQKRKVPNPNVLIELGYALAVLGWDRVIMLFNKNFGDFPGDLPFDLDRRRVISFKVADRNDKNGKTHLKTLISQQLLSILDSNPPRPDLRFNPHVIQRERDLKNLTEVLSVLHIPTLDSFIQNITRKVENDIFDYSYAFNDIVSSALFHLYDKEAATLILNLKTCLLQCLSYGNYYSGYGSNSNASYFKLSPLFNNVEHFQAVKQEIDAKSATLESSLKKLLNHIRENYIDLCIEELSESAYIQYQNGLKQNLQ